MKFLKISLLFLSFLFTYSQNLNDLNSVKSPSFNELTKFEDVPINYSHGLPNISYSLVSLPSGYDELNLNLSINYHPNNISYYNSATDVGLGWSLVGLGSISRSVSRLPDELHNYNAPGTELPHPYNTIYHYGSNPNNNLPAYDDVYYYNFFGYSGKFIFKFDGSNFEIVNLTNNNLQFSFQKTNTNFLIIDKFIVKDTNGYTYHFEVKNTEKFNKDLYNFLGSPKITPIINPNSPIKCYTIIGLFEETNGLVICEDNPDFIQLMNTHAFSFNHMTLSEDYTSEFLLTRVTGKNNSNVFEFNYNPIPKVPNPTQLIEWYINSNLVINKLSNITSKLGRVDFDYQCDLELRRTLNDVCALKSISLYNLYNQKISEVELVNTNPSPDEFTLTNPIYGIYSTVGNVSTSINSNFKISPRRFLMEFNIKDINSNQSLKYKFNYKTSNYNPEYNIFKLDYHGFIDYRESICDVNGLDYEGMTNKNTCDIGVLKEVELPTGDKVVYEFESNTYSLSVCGEVLDVNNPNSMFTNEFTFNDSSNDFNQSQFENSINETQCDEINEEFYFLRNSENTSFVSIQNLTASITQFQNEAYTNFQVTEAGFYNFTLSDVITWDCDPLVNEYTSFPFMKVDGINITNNNGNVSDLIFYTTRSYCDSKMRAYLSVGTYQIKTISNRCASATIKVIKETRVTSNNLKRYIYGGGLRIKRIYTLNASTSQIENERKFYYENFEDANASSGFLYSKSGVPYGIDFPQTIFTGKFDSKVIYKNVRVEHVGKGYKKYSFHTYNTYLSSYNLLTDGLLDFYEVYDNQNNLLKSSKKYYEVKYSTTDFNNELNLFGLYINIPGINSWGTPKYSFIKKEYSLNKDFLHNQEVLNKTVSTFKDSNFQTEKSINFDSNNNKLITENYYLSDLPNVANYNLFIDENLTEKVLKSKAYFNSDLIKEDEMIYTPFNNFILFQKIQSKKGSQDSNINHQITKYNLIKKPLEVVFDGGKTVSYIFAYHHTLPVAKLENIAYDQIPSNLIAAIQQATDATNYNEQNVVNALNALRTSTDANMQKAMITTYVHKPLVGVTKITDPKGDTQTFLYDTFNRLKEVRDKDNNLLQESEYWYRTQN